MMQVNDDQLRIIVKDDCEGQRFLGLPIFSS